MSLRNHKYYLGDVAEQTDAQGLDPVWHDLRTLADLERLRGSKTREEARAIMRPPEELLQQRQGTGSIGKMPQFFVM